MIERSARDASKDQLNTAMASMLEAGGMMLEDLNNRIKDAYAAGRAAMDRVLKERGVAELSKRRDRLMQDIEHARCPLKVNDVLRSKKGLYVVIAIDQRNHSSGPENHYLGDAMDFDIWCESLNEDWTPKKPTKRSYRDYVERRFKVKEALQLLTSETRPLRPVELQEQIASGLKCEECGQTFGGAMLKQCVECGEDTLANSEKVWVCVNCEGKHTAWHCGE